MTDKPKKPRGFALLSPEQRRAVAAMGGKAMPGDKRSFAVNRDLAASAGAVGGSKSRLPNPKGQL